MKSRSMILSKSYLLLKNLVHGVIIVIGSGKMGKSCTAHSLADLFWPHLPKYILDPENIDVSIFPEYVHVKDTNEIPPRSVIFIEDVNRVFSSRKSGNNNALQRWLSVVSQKDYIVILSSQSFADTDMAWARSQNTIFVHKWMWPDDIQFERQEIQVQQVSANDAIVRLALDSPTIDFRSICYFARHGDTMSITPVEWWEDGKHSHIFREVEISLISP